MSQPTVPQPIELSYAPPDAWRSRWGKSFLAVCGTFVCWGLGHFLVGNRSRAVRWFVAWLVVITTSLSTVLVPQWVPALMVLVPLQGVLALAALVDAFIAGRRSEWALLPRAWQRYGTGLILLVLAWGFGRGAGWVLRHRVEAFVISSQGNAPTIVPGDRILIHKQVAPRRWDLVVFHPPVQPNQVFLMRLVGMPGEKVEIVDGRVRINDSPLAPPDSNLRYDGTLPFGQSRFGNAGRTGYPILLGSDEYYVLGDNTKFAYDSRWWPVAAPGHQVGAVPRSAIVGRATAIYFPPSRWRMFH